MVRKLASDDFKKLALISSLAMILPSSIAVGLLIGYFLDRWLKTSPWMLLSWTVFGVISGLLNLFKGIKRYLEENQGPSRKPYD
ncbi:MAG: AtpZ/AtpI family protein [Candidatus Saccharicenans sp.]